MCTNESLSDKLVARTDDNHHLGTDAKGRRHYWCPVLQRVWVTVDGDVEHVARVTNLRNWVEYTTQRVGWDDLFYTTQGLATQLAGRSRGGA